MNPTSSWQDLTAEDPQNPYQSYMVCASAGSGKTYQLAQRFLKLVAAGAPPESILTLTFTQKAAAEMKQRVLDYSAQLCEDEGAAQLWHKSMQDYYRHARDHLWMDPLHPPPKPLSPQEVSCAVARMAPKLAISTIDAALGGWIKRFTLESNSDHLTSNVQIMAAFEKKRVHDEAWQDLFPAPPPHGSPRSALQSRAHDLFCSLRCHGFSLVQIRELCTSLEGLSLMNAGSSKAGHGAALEYLQRLLHAAGQKLSCEAQYPGIASPPTAGDVAARTAWREQNEELFWQAYKAPLQQIIAATKNPQLYMEALEKKDLEDLMSSPLITREGRISRSKVSAKAREQRSELQEAITSFEEGLHNYFDLGSLADISARSREILQLYELWKQRTHRRQRKLQRWSYDDITLAMLRLFSPENERGWGAFYQIQKPLRHLMIDEFQDTNAAQWQIFQTLAEELVSAHSDDGLPRTVFWVGDAKQCLYGFRQADPAIMNKAQQWMHRREKPVVHLDASYRSHPTILRFINTVFMRFLSMPDYRLMESAFLEGEAVSGLNSSVELLPLICGKGGALQEAQQLADHIQGILAHAHRYPVGAQRRNIQPDDIAILFRDSTHGAAFEEALRKRGLATALERSSAEDFYKSQEVRDLMSLLRWLIDPAEPLALWEVCRSPLVGMTDEILGLWISECSHACGPAEGVLEQGISLLEEHIELEGWGQQQLSALQILEDFINFRSAAPFAVRFLTLIADLAVKEAYRRVLPASEVQRAWHHMDVFEEAVALWGHEEQCSPAELLGYFTSKREPPASALQGSRGIRLMTIHKAKGLEFPMVCLSQCASRWYRLPQHWGCITEFEASAADGEAHSTLVPWSLCRRVFAQGFVSRIKASLETRLYGESQRLLYVALSRAAQYLVISGHQRSAATSSSEDQKQQQPFFYSVLHRTAELLSDEEGDDIRLHQKHSEATEHHISDVAGVAKETAEEGIELQPPSTTSPSAENPSHGPLERYDMGRKVVRPHRATLDHSMRFYLKSRGSRAAGEEQKKRQYFEKLTAEELTLRGLYIHQILEVSCLKGRFCLPPEARWRNLCSAQQELKLPPNFRSLAEGEAQQSFQHMADLLHSAVEVRCEVPLAGKKYATGDLILGSADLVLDCGEHYKIIDWKSNLIYREPPSEQVRQQLQNYGAQLALYRQCLRGQKSVFTYVFLTSSVTLIEVQHGG